MHDKTKLGQLPVNILFNPRDQHTLTTVMPSLTSTTCPEIIAEVDSLSVSVVPPDTTISIKVIKMNTCLHDILHKHIDTTGMFNLLDYLMSDIYQSMFRSLLSREVVDYMEIGWKELATIRGHNTSITYMNDLVTIVLSTKHNVHDVYTAATYMCNDYCDTYGHAHVVVTLDNNSVVITVIDGMTVRTMLDDSTFSRTLHMFLAY